MRGTSYQQDSRFPDKNKRMIQKSIWPEIYQSKIDMKKVDYELIKVWIQAKIQSLLKNDDDIIPNIVISLLDQAIQKQEKPNAKNIHVALSGFLQDKTVVFMAELWLILDSAQKSPRGIPQCLIEQKKLQEEKERQKMRQLQKKKNRINNDRFNEVIKRNLPRDRRNYDDKSYRVEKEHRADQGSEKQQKKQKQKHSKRKIRQYSRSRSKSSEQSHSKSRQRHRKHKKDQKREKRVEKSDKKSQSPKNRKNKDRKQRSRQKQAIKSSKKAKGKEKQKVKTKEKRKRSSDSRKSHQSRSVSQSHSRSSKFRSRSNSQQSSQVVSSSGQKK